MSYRKLAAGMSQNPHSTTVGAQSDVLRPGDCRALRAPSTALRPDRREEVVSGLRPDRREEVLSECAQDDSIAKGIA